MEQVFARPNIGISKCINLAPVRYNGGIIRDEFAEKLGKFVNFVPVCPEVEIGLGVPRKPVNLVKLEDGTIHMIQTETNNDYTDQMLAFAENFFRNIHDVDGFLLKAKSPSCGVKDTKLFAYHRRGLVGKTSGLFAQKTMEFFPNLPVEDEGRLNDPDLRRNFLTRIFALSDLRENFLKKDKISELIEFHSRFKYLLMTYNQSKLKEMGRVLANWKDYGLEEAKIKYAELFRQSFRKLPSKRAHYNTITHIMGHFSKKLTHGEKAYFSKLLKRYLEEKVTLQTVLLFLREFTVRFEDLYLVAQRYIYPFPEELESLD